MFAKLALFSVLLVMITAAPSPGGHYKHVTIHVPYKVHTIHHHHVQKTHVPVIKEVPVIKHVYVPVVKHVPVIKKVEVEKIVHVPIHVEEHKGWESEALHGWN